MMKHKRFLSLLLAVVLVFGMLPTASATENEPAAAPNCTCGVTDGAHEETCAMNIDYTDICEVCGTPSCTASHVWCDTCQKYDCGLTHVWCDTCQKNDCGVTHVWCETCQKYDCGIDHSPSVPCMICGTENCTATHVKCETCGSYDCATDHASAETTETTEATETTESTEAKAEPTEKEETVTGPHVGDKVWIKTGSLVYKDAESGKSYQLLGNYEVKIKSIITDENGEAAWYEFEFTSLGVGEVVLQWGGYKYVLIENTTEEEPPAETTEPSVEETEVVTIVGETSIQVSGMIPEGVSLTAEAVEVDQTSIPDTEETAPQLVFAYDIKLIDEEGNEWQPENGETVTVTLDAASLGLEDGDIVSIQHEHNDEQKELGEFTVAEGKLTFTTDGFSVFYGYTVDFEYDGTWHSIGGGSDIYLYELFAQLGIEHSTSEVSSVSFSDPSLITVSKKIVDGYTGRKDWHIQSLEPFTSEEVLTIGLKDGTELLINVYDATYTALSNNLTLNNGDVINGATISGNINITLNGTVTVKNVINIPAGASLTITGSGTLKRDAAFLGRMFSVTGGTLTINGSGIAIDGGASWSSSEVANSTREKLNVTSGPAATSAAIYVDNNGTVNLTAITMKNLYTASGQAPAIHVTGSTDTTTSHSTLNMTNVTIKDCATMSGQAITLFNDCLANLNSCKYLNNYSGGTYAGALKAGGPNYFCQLNMTNCEARGNYSSGWGGVLLWAANNKSNGKESKATIDGCTFTSNKARYLGGALSNEAIMEVKNTTIKNNVAMAGGGIATFPFTLTETQAEGGNACGLTLGSGNTIEDNTAFATGEFTPFLYQDKDVNGTTTRNGIVVKTYNSDATIADDSVIGSPITYTGGGGGVWCYMNKPNWTCSLEIGSGNELLSNDANNVGGGVYVHKVAGETTTLAITGAIINNNEAPNGGGVAVKDATVTINAGEITANTATKNGGGIYVDNGTCTVSGTGSVSNNTAANGGGIYLANGSSMTISGGVITGNTATPAASGNTAYQNAAESGVGGGVYVASGTLIMSEASEDTPVGLYGNTAAFAADDAYASSKNTTLTLPKVEDMPLNGTAYAQVTGWYLDYNDKEANYDKSPFNSVENPGRYDTQSSGFHVSAGDSINADDGFYCLTLGLTPKLIIEKQVLGTEKPTESFTFTVKQGTTNLGTVTFDPDDFKANSAGTAWVAVDDTTLSSMPVGTVTVTENFENETAYKFTSAKTEVTVATYNTETVSFTMTDSGEKVIFINELAIADIVITKTVNGVTPDVDQAENQTFVFHVKGTDNNTKDVDMKVVINISPDDVENGVGTGSVIVKSVPIGSYTVTEESGWSWRYDPVSGTVSKTITADISKNNFDFVNNRNRIYWLSGDNYKWNLFDKVTG